MLVLWNLFFTFFAVGMVSIGGGYAMTQQILDATLQHGWMDRITFNAGVAISNMSPGPFACSLATFIGIKVAGITGALISMCGMILPSVLIITLIARFFYGFQDNKNVQGVLAGIRPVVIGLIAAAVYSLAKDPFTTSTATRIGIPGNWAAVLIAIVMAVAMRKYKMHPILSIVLSALIGIAIYV